MFVLVIATHGLKVEVCGRSYQDIRNKELPRAFPNRPNSPGWLAASPAGFQDGCGAAAALATS